MLWTDQLKVTTIKGEDARDVQTFRYRDDQRVYEIELGIGYCRRISAERV